MVAPVIQEMDLELSINTDYLEDIGDPKPSLKKISEAGFTYVHWCHEWDTDFIYSESEINRIITLLEKYNLKVLDLQASEGKKNNWVSKNESLRIAGIKLVKNRIYMANKLSCDVIVLHFKREPSNESEKQKYWDILHKSLNELKPYAQKHNVKIALENYGHEDCHEIKKLFSEYDSNFLGLCYDSGHGNMRDGLKTLEKLKDRLVCIHLHDNDGKTDQHKLLFSGTIDWNKLAKILVKSSYKKCISLEVSMENANILDETIFLSKAYATGLKFSKLVENYSSNI
ncbi:MAG: sugar phosphate isomerase/epimerase [Nanoarchaeota archaeon]|nr:sugar phosphate isomerase/epimerase [Nanoarchaeota archaeon]